MSPPTCQKCGGDIAGWLCQNCPAEFRENDDGVLIFDVEAPAEAGEPEALRMAYKTGYQEGVEDSDGNFCRDACEEGWGQYLEALRAQPQAREEAQPVYALEVVRDPTVEGAKRFVGVTHPAPDALRAPESLASYRDTIGAQPQARPWGWDYEICTGCSASLTMADIKASGKVSCCPDRRMVTVRELVDAYDARRVAEGAK